MEIHWVGLTDLEEAARSRAETRIERLTAGHQDLIDLRIAGRETNHHHTGQEVRITCQARGRELVASRTATDFGLALHEALDAFEREVHRLREKRRDRSRKPPRSGVAPQIPETEE